MFPVLISAIALLAIVVAYTLLRCIRSERRTEQKLQAYNAALRAAIEPDVDVPQQQPRQRHLRAMPDPKAILAGVGAGLTAAIAGMRRPALAGATALGVVSGTVMLLPAETESPSMASPPPAEAGPSTTDTSSGSPEPKSEDTPLRQPTSTPEPDTDTTTTTSDSPAPSTVPSVPPEYAGPPSMAPPEKAGPERGGAPERHGPPETAPPEHANPGAPADPPSKPDVPEKPDEPEPDRCLHLVIELCVPEIELTEEDDE